MRVRLLLVVLLLAGCESPTPDSNTEVFRTVDETLSARRAQQVRRWKESATALVQRDRPDLQVEPAAGTGITIQVDGLRRTIDLTPIEHQLAGQTGSTDSILEPYLRQQLSEFDRHRLPQLSLEQVRPLIRPVLLNGRQLTEWQALYADEGPLHSTEIVPDLHWAPAARWGRASDPVPLGPATLRAWGIGPPQADEMALHHLRASMGSDLFETIDFGPMGRIGQLKPGVDAAIVLVPDFLRLVRQQWREEVNLALLMATPNQVRFLDSERKQLLDVIYPQWQRLVEDAPRPLARRPLLLADSGISLLPYTPPVQVRQLTTLPTTRPVLPRPATQPTTQRYYIVR